MEYKHELTESEKESYYEVPIVFTCISKVYVPKNAVDNITEACNEVEYGGQDVLPPPQYWDYCGDLEVDDDLLED